MSLDLGSLLVHLKLDGTGYKQEVRSVETVMNETSRTMDKFAVRAERVLKGLIAYVGVRAAVRELERWKNAARDAVESENLFRISMGKSEEAARKWSQEISAALGLNQIVVRQRVGTFNVMLESMGMAEEASYNMSRGLVQLAYDMSSFYNLPVEQAFNKIQSGLVGMGRPLQELGILINETMTEEYALRQGWIKQGENLSELGKVYARYGALVEQTTKAQGDLARTSNEAANMEKRLQAQFQEIRIELGNRLLPTYQKALQGISGWLQSNLDDVTDWADGTLSVLQQVAKGLDAIFKRLAVLTRKVITPVIIEKMAQERYKTLFPEDKAAFTLRPGLMTVSGESRVVGPKLPEEYKRIVDQLTLETAQVDREREIARIERQKNLRGLYGDVDLPKFDTTPPLVEPSEGIAGTKDVMGQAKRVEDIWRKMLENRIRSTAQMYNQIGAYDEIWFSAQKSALELDRTEYEQLGIDKVHIEEWWISQVQKLRDEQTRRAEEDAEKQKRLLQEQEQRAERIIHANAQLYQGLENVTGAYEAQRALLDDQKRRYEEIGADVQAINAWYARQIELLDITIGKTGTWAEQIRAAAAELKIAAKDAGGPWYQFAKEIPQLLESGLMRMAQDMRNFTDHMKSMLREIYFEAIRIAFIKPAAQGLAGAFSSIGTAVVGGVLGAGTSVSSSMGAPGTGGYHQFAEGGVAWTPQLAAVAEKEPELITPFSKLGSLGGDVTINVINESGMPLGVSRQQEYMVSDRRIIDVVVSAVQTNPKVRHEIAQARRS